MSKANQPAELENIYLQYPEELRLGIISRALWAMPGKRRQLLMMSRFDGLSYAEISRRVNLPETVVRKHIAKALAGCQRALQN